MNIKMGPKSKNVKTIGKCGKCNRFFTSIGALKSHVTYFHKTKATCILNGKKINFNTKASKTGILKKKLSIDPSLTYHWQDMIPDELIRKYIIFQCSACLYMCEKYKDIIKHIDSVHRESLISFFFPNQEVFLEWKNELEKITNCCYEPKIKFEMRKIYVCSSHIATTEKNTLIVCTSIITLREYTKGIQVFFFRAHSCHVADYYQPSPKNEKYLIYDKNKDIDKISQNKIPQTDTSDEKEALVTNFRKIMQSLSDDCVKLDYTNLLLFFEKAKSIQDDIHDTLEKNKIIEQDSPKVMIESVNGNINIVCCTRENEQAETIKTESLNTTPLILNTFSLSGSDLSESKLKTESEELQANTEKDVVPNVVEKPAIPKFTFTPENKNFNDTYESFVAQQSGGKMIKKPLKPINIERSTDQKNNHILIKTVAIPVDPMFTTKLDKEKKPSDEGKCNEITVPSNVSKPKQLFSKIKAVNIPITNMAPVSSFYNNKTVKIQPSSMYKTTKMKSKVKTKLGQFSPKKNELTNKKRESLKNEKANNDKLVQSKDSPLTKFQNYEVKERDNDCNILILKF